MIALHPLGRGDRANPAAIACYRRGGFADTGDLWHGDRAGPQHVLRMPLKAGG